MDVGCTLDLGQIIHLGCVLLHPHRVLSLRHLGFLLVFDVAWLTKLANCQFLAHVKYLYIVSHNPKLWDYGTGVT